MTTTPHSASLTPAEPGTGSAPEPFSVRLAALTRAQHEEAEHSTFMRELLGGRLDRTAYTRLAGQLAHVYAALEARAAELTEHPVASRVIDPGLHRSAALDADLTALEGPGWRERHPVLPATREYVARIGGVDGAGYLAHHYTRYLGDLSGGFVVARMVSRHYGLTPAEPGLLFHHFSDIPKPKPYKDAYRRRLDEAGASLPPGQQQAVIAEAQRAFRHNTAVFAALAAPVAA